MVVVLGCRASSKTSDRRESLLGFFSRFGGLGTDCDWISSKAFGATGVFLGSDLAALDHFLTDEDVLDDNEGVRYPTTLLLAFLDDLSNACSRAISSLSFPFPLSLIAFSIRYIGSPPMISSEITSPRPKRYPSRSRASNLVPSSTTSEFRKISSAACRQTSLALVFDINLSVHVYFGSASW